MNKQIRTLIDQGSRYMTLCNFMYPVFKHHLEVSP